MAKEQKLKTCFVIAPIGDEGSEIRQRSDQVLKHIIRPAAEECGYTAIRADKISEPGIITLQVIQHLIDDDLVIADLTGRNPNVFYELAVRHTVKKPVVQIIQSRETIPFDVGQTRTIHVDHRDLDSVANCKSELIKHIRSAEKDPSKVDSPISTAVDLKSLRQSENPLEKSNAEIISMLQDLRSMIGNINTSPQPTVASKKYADHVVYIFAGLSELVSFLVNLPYKQLLNIKPTVIRFIDTLEYLAQESHLPERHFDLCHQIATESHKAIQNKFLHAIPPKRQKKTGRPKIDKDT